MDTAPVSCPPRRALLLSFLGHPFSITLGLVWTLMGLAFLAAGIVLLLGGHGIPPHRAAGAAATVVQVLDARSPGGGPTYYLLELAFVPPGGREVTTRGWLRVAAGGEEPREGGTVELIYDRESPLRTAFPDGDKGVTPVQLLLPLAFTLPGGTVLLFGLSWARRRYRVLRRHLLARGTIVSISPNRMIRVRGRFPNTLRYRFPLPGGGTTEGRAVVYLKRRQQYPRKAGEPVTVAFRPEDPRLNYPLTLLENPRT